MKDGELKMTDETKSNEKTEIPNEELTVPITTDVENESNEEISGSSVDQPMTDSKNELDEDDFEVEEANKWVRVKTILLGLAVLIILAGFVSLFYRFYPLPSKITGRWEASTVNGNYLINNDGKKTTFVMENLNGVVGMDMSFESQLTAEAENEYFVKETEVFLELYHEYINDEAIKEIQGDGTNFEEISDNKKVLKLKYTKEGVKASFGDEDLNGLFKYVLRDFDWRLQGKTLKLRNASFANGGVSFTKVKED